MSQEYQSFIRLFLETNAHLDRASENLSILNDFFNQIENNETLRKYSRK
jgi:hypothetical protein